jgi:hypothetical protein
MSTVIPGKEIRWVLLWSILIVGLACLPYLYACLVTPDDMQFTGLLSNPIDGNSYLAKMRQGAQGKWLFHLPYTSEDHDGAFIFTYYLFLGRLSAFLGWPLILTYHLARVINSFILLFVAYCFLSLFNLDWRSRRAAFLLIGFSSGLGWLAVSFNVFAPDLWVPEAITFYSIFANPHFPLAVALMLLVFTFVLVPLKFTAPAGPQTSARLRRAPRPELGTKAQSRRSVEPSGGFWRGLWSTPSKRKFPWVPVGNECGQPSVGKEAILAAFSSLLLGIVQPFCVVTVYSVLGGYFILRLLKEKRLPWPEILRGMVAGAATAPIIAYDYSVYTFNPVLRAWSEQNITPSPPLWAYAIAYGFVLVLAVGGAVLAIRRRSKADLFLLAWVIVNGLLLYAPFGLQRRLVTGLHVPLCILAAMALSRYVLPRFLPARKTLILGAFIVLTMPSNLFVLMASMAGAAQQDSRLYLYRDEAEAMTWLQENTQPTDIVLASPEMGLFIPAWAGNRVLYGHPFETIEAEKKRSLAEMFYQAQTEESIRRGIIKGHHITHVFYGSRERALSGGQLETVPMLSEAYTNPGVTIYQVSPVAE